MRGDGKGKKVILVIGQSNGGKGVRKRDGEGKGKQERENMSKSCIV